MKKIIPTALIMTLALSTPAFALFGLFDSKPEVIQPVKVAEQTEAEIQAYEPDLQVGRVDQLAYHTKKLNIEDLKLQHNEIAAILNTFEALESDLLGYEERSVVTNLKNFFRDKYLVNQIDLINIKQNLNKALVSK